MDGTHIRSRPDTRRCGACGEPTPPWAPTCPTCHAPRQRKTVAIGRGTLSGPARPRPPVAWRETTIVMGVGALFAPTLAFVPILRYVGWFLASLVHEIGHCIAAWFFGAPAYPAIRIDGHAAAMHSDQKTILALAVLAGLVYLTWLCRRHPIAVVLCALGTLLYPALAFTGARELIHLVAGHVSELAFASVFFYRALSGGFTESLPERVTYACVASFLLARNVVLDFGLLTSASARSTYAASGSFGLTQDFVRTARMLDCRLATVGGYMLLLSACVLPLTWLLWRRHETRAAGTHAQKGG